MAAASGIDFIFAFHFFHSLTMQDIIIIGGGIVGLATAYQILENNPHFTLSLLEKEKGPALHQTGNNSGVIHSGIYYKPGSLKARNCTLGYASLLEFCNRHEIPYERCGKIIMATEQNEIPLLEKLYSRGLENGLTGLKMLKSEELAEYEPHVKGIRGIHVPQTGIVDYKLVSAQLADKIQHKGGKLLYRQKAVSIKRLSQGVQVKTATEAYEAKIVVNCAGLYSDKIASLTERKIDFRIIPFRGEYYKIRDSKKFLVKNLIYPVPNPEFPFLGVHFTRLIQGGIEAGPNAVFAFAREGYSKSAVNPGELFESLLWPGFRKIAAKYWRTGAAEMYRSFSKKAFTVALQRLIPEITINDLEPGGAGVRAQACDRHGNLIDDFLILENDVAINVCNAPSPAATSSLAIGATIAGMILKRFA